MDVAREIRRFNRWRTVWGVRHTCPFCKRPMNHFKPAGLKHSVFTQMNIVGGGFREGAQCFVCGSIDRERLVYLYLKHESILFKRRTEKKLNVLHIAPEPVLMQKLKTINNINYVRANISASRADIRLDATQLPVKNDMFDFIIMNHVLEHIHDDTSAMRELYRALKPKTGVGIFQVPIAMALKETVYDPTVNSDEERVAKYGQEDHIRLYGTDYKSKLESVGFKVNQFDWSKSPSLNPTQRNKYGLIENELLHVCCK